MQKLTPDTSNLEPVFVILHDIRSSENVGSIFRTSDAVGVSKIYLTGYTPAPVDRFKRKNTKLAKASLGAEEFVPWEKAQNIFELLQKLQKDGVQVVAVEQDPASIPYAELKRGGAIAFILGNEVEGLPKDVLKVCDAIVEIPMHGKKESLNVSVSAGIVLFHSRL